MPRNDKLIVSTLIREFPGLVNHEDDVDGSDLVMRLSELLREEAELEEEEED